MQTWKHEIYKHETCEPMKVRKPRCDESHTGVFGRNSYQILKFCLALNSYEFYIIPSLIIWWSRSSFSITVPWMTCRTGFFSALSGPGS